jgi:hypothetical protein
MCSLLHLVWLQLAPLPTQVRVLYTAPTLIRSLMQFGDHWVTEHDRSSLRILGTVGEPINPHAWDWYHQVFAAVSVVVALQCKSVAALQCKSVESPDAEQWTTVGERTIQHTNVSDWY